MSDSERYRRGAHTVTDIKYHFVWKTKYSYGVLSGEIANRTRQILRELHTPLRSDTSINK